MILNRAYHYIKVLFGEHHLVGMCIKDQQGKRTETIVQKNGNSPDLFQKQLLSQLKQVSVLCKQMTPKADQRQESTEIRKSNNQHC